jgi:hypothetical protein
LATVNETPAKISSAPKDFEREFAVISDIVISGAWCVLRIS